MARRGRSSRIRRSFGHILGASILIRNVHAAYGAVRVLEDISLTVAPGEIVALLGTNGNGKSTLMKCIMGIVRPSAGQISGDLDGTQHDLIGWTTEHIVDLGIGLVPEGRRLFPKLTVEKNLVLGAFPRPAQRRRQIAGTLSGGEQQMLALGRALMLVPRILLIDEPSVGLAPVLVSHTIDQIAQLKRQYQLTILMAEQNFAEAIRIADRGYVIVHGKIAFEGKSVNELNDHAMIRKFYLGA